MDTLGVENQELYVKWLRIYFRMGNDDAFKQTHGVWFPNPLWHSQKKYLPIRIMSSPSERAYSTIMVKAYYYYYYHYYYYYYYFLWCYY